METFGILLSLPGAFVASLIYCWLLIHWVQPRFPKTSPLRLLSGFILILFALECVTVLTVGVVRSREVFGPAFYAVHRLCFYLGVPAMANILVLADRRWILAKWYIAPFVCAPLGFCLVIVEYVVYEGLFGVDGLGGPFGSAPPF